MKSSQVRKVMLDGQMYKRFSGYLAGITYIQDKASVVLIDCGYAFDTSTKKAYQPCLKCSSYLKSRYVGKYAYVNHFSLGCCSEGKVVYCLRQKTDLGKATLCIHPAGECPLSNYTKEAV